MILITGASRGIGKYLLEYFLKQGEVVCGTYLHTQPDTALESHYHKVDITNVDDVEALMQKLGDKLKDVVLINCAGINYNGIAHKSDPGAWARVIQTNLIGTFHVIRAVLPFMREQGFGRIINMSSVVAQKGIPGTSAYAASKSGMWGMTRSIAIENANKGITVNCLNLGYFDIGMISEVPEKFQDAIKQDIPTKEFGDPRNILEAIHFLIKADYVNGTGIDVNAGLI